MGNYIQILEQMYDAYKNDDVEEYEWLASQALLEFGISSKGVFWIEWVNDLFSSYFCEYCEGSHDLELMIHSMRYLKDNEEWFYNKEVSGYKFLTMLGYV